MNNLPIQITTHHLSVSDSLCRFARKKITALRRFANDALAADVVVRRHAGAKERFSASARLALPGRDIHARAVAGDLYAAIGKLVCKLARLSRKRKTRLAKTFEHPGRSETSTELTVPPHPQNVLPEPSDIRGQSRTHEGGQEMRVFPFRRKGAFAASPIPIGRGIRPVKTSVRLVLSLLAVVSSFLFLSLAGCSSAPEAPPKIVEISADDRMKYSVTAFDVTPGEKVSITLTNTGTTLKTAGGHDLVVLQKNTNVKRFLEAASLEASHDYVSAGSQKDVLASTKLLGPGERDTITFTAPYVPADYDFVCSFPGHAAQGMKGVMTVR